MIYLCKQQQQPTLFRLQQVVFFKEYILQVVFFKEYILQVVFFKEYSVFVTLHLLWVQRCSVAARFTLTNHSNSSLAAGAMFFGGCMIYPYKPQQQFTCCRCNVLWWMHDLPLQMTATANICQLQQVVFFKEYSIFSTLHLLLMQPVVRRISLFHPHKQQKSQCCDCNLWPLSSGTVTSTSYYSL